MEYFIKVFKRFAREARDVNFVLCDVAYDIPACMDNIFYVCKKGREMRKDKNTIYHGRGKDRRQHGYSRFYNKKKQLKQVKSIDVAVELSRVEMVYRPSTFDRFSMTERLTRPPDFTRLYICFVLGDMDIIPKKRKALIQAIMSLREPYKNQNWYQRDMIEKDLTSTQTKVDFNEIAKQQWNDMVGLYIAIATGNATKVA